MSITVRHWSKNDLQRIDNAFNQGQLSLEDRRLITIFLNVKTFSNEAIRHYPYPRRKHYNCDFGEFYATDDKAAVWFIEQEYNRKPNYLNELTTTTRRVKL